MTRQANQLARYLRAGIPEALIARKRGRLKVTGKNLIDVNGNPIVLRGANYGHDAFVQLGDPGIEVQWGFNSVRIVFRMLGNYQRGKTDSYSTGDFCKVTVAQLTWLKNICVAAKAAGMIVQLARDSDCMQNAWQQMDEGNTDTYLYCTCPQTGLPGANAFNAAGAPWRAEYLLSLQLIMRVLRGLVDIIELLVEPTPTDSGCTWANANKFFTDARRVVRAEDDQIVFMHGGEGYHASNLEEAWDPTWDNSGWTCDILDGLASNPTSLAFVIKELDGFRQERNVWVHSQQFGIQTSTDPDDTLTAAACEQMRTAQGGTIGWHWWEAEPDNQASYGWYWNDGVRHSKPNRIAVMRTAAAGVSTYA